MAFLEQPRHALQTGQQHVLLPVCQFAKAFQKGTGQQGRLGLDKSLSLCFWPPIYGLKLQTWYFAQVRLPVVVFLPLPPTFTITYVLKAVVLHIKRTTLGYLDHPQ